MLAIFQRALGLLGARDRRSVYLLMGSSALAAIVQTLVLLMMMPFILLFTNPELLQTSELAQRVAQFLGIDSYRQFLAVVGIGAALVVILGNLFVAGEHLLSYRYLGGLTHRLVSRVLQRMLAQPYEHLATQHTAGLADVVLEQVERVVEGVVASFVALFSSLMLMLAIITVLLVVSPGTTLLAAGGLLAAYLTLFLLTRRRIAQGGEELTALGGDISAAVKEALDGAREIKARRAEGFFASRFERAHGRAVHLGVHYQVAQVLPYYVLEAVVVAGFVGAALYFLFRTGDSGMALSYLALYALAVYRLVPALRGVFENASSVYHSADAIQAVAPYCAGEDANDVVRRELPPLARELRLEGVAYRYPGSERQQVRGVDLVIPAGSSVCLFGASGAGKSTLLNLLAGLTHPQQGRVLCDGVPLDATTVDAWREQVAYLPQQIYLYADTLAANIAFGRELAAIDARRVAEVGALASLDAVVARLPQGYRSLLGEHGATLSGGERQRVGVARALYTDPGVLLFDESFTGLDGETRTAILDRLFAMRGRTLVFSSHESAVASRCERVVLVEEGRVVAQGSYAELLAGNPRFAELLSLLDTGGEQQWST
jgi:ABC-type multidrug transport system fused ATPase/permease subunit